MLIQFAICTKLGAYFYRNYALDFVHIRCYNRDNGKGGDFGKGYTTYKSRQEKLIGQGTLTALKNGTGGLDAKTIARLCEVLDCQPGDLMEYVKENNDAK